MEILLVIDMQQKYMNSYEPDLMTRVNTRISTALEAVKRGLSEVDLQFSFHLSYSPS